MDIVLALILFSLIAFPAWFFTKQAPGDWHLRADCKCGWSCAGRVGETVYKVKSQFPVCPKCASNSIDFSIKVMRFNNGALEDQGMATIADVTAKAEEGEALAWKSWEDSGNMNPFYCTRSHCWWWLDEIGNLSNPRKTRA